VSTYFEWTLNWESLSGLGRVCLECSGDIPGQEFFDPVDRMFREPCQNGTEIERGVDSGRFHRSELAAFGGSISKSALKLRGILDNPAPANLQKSTFSDDR